MLSDSIIIEYISQLYSSSFHILKVLHSSFLANAIRYKFQKIYDSLYNKLYYVIFLQYKKDVKCY